jgi:hypothetical protein
MSTTPAGSFLKPRSEPAACTQLPENPDLANFIVRHRRFCPTSMPPVPGRSSCDRSKGPITAPVLNPIPVPIYEKYPKS